MAQILPCDICQQEPAVQMLTNLEDGTVLTMGAACLPQFYGQSTLIVMNAGEHAGPPTKCQACRRTHERMTTPVAPLSIPADEAEPRTADGTEPAVQAAGE